MLKQLTRSLLAAALSLGALAVVAAPVAGAATTSPLTGYDISFPQCGGNLPAVAGFGVVGVNNGHPLSTNPCLSSELQWANSTVNGAPAFYMNTSNPGPAYTPSWPTGQQSPDVCAGANSPQCSYDFGWNAARVSYAAAVAAESSIGQTSPAAAARQARWWLDVETGNQWETIETGYGRTVAYGANDQAVLHGSLDYLSTVGVTTVGIYSTAQQWQVITGGLPTSFASIPVWMPGYATLSAAEAACTATSFTGGRVAMIQYPSNGLDGDYMCGLVSTPSANSVSVAATAGYTDQLVVSGNVGTANFVQTSGLPALSVSATGLVATTGPLATGTYIASGTLSDASSDVGTFTYVLSVGTITQGAPTSGLVKSPGSSTFTAQLAVSGNNGVVTFVQATGAPALSVSATGLLTTSGTLPAGTYSVSGTTSDPNGDSGVFLYTLSVGTITQSLPITGSVLTTSSSSFTNQLAVIRNDGAVTFTQSSGAPNLTVSSTGLVTTTGALAAGSYTVRGTTSDPFGDIGTFIYTLIVKAPVVTPVVVVPQVSHVTGHAVAGLTRVLVISGTGFYGRPSVTSHAGTSALVVTDNSKQLGVRVKVAPGSRNGVFTFTITFAKHETCRVKYNQR